MPTPNSFDHWLSGRLGDFPGKASTLTFDHWQSGRLGPALATGTLNANAAPAGLSATSSVGATAATGNAIAALAGLALAAALGAAALTANASASPAGVAAATALGTVTASGTSSGSNGTATPAGIAGSATVGTPALAGGATTTPGGVNATSARGATLAAGFANALPSGTLIVSALGEVSVSTTSNVAAYPAGVGMWARIGSVDFSATTEALETIDDCVVLPHLPDWSAPIKLKRAWSTSIATGLDGGEDRAAERTAPVRTQSYTVQAHGPEENAVLGARVRAALKSGRAVTPLFGRAVACAHTTTPGQVECVYPRWNWALGDYVYLATPSHDGLNSRRQIDAGGSGWGAWEDEIGFTPTGGATLNNMQAITPITGLDCPPQNVLRTARYVDATSGPAEGISFTATRLPAKPCRVRLWFAFTAAAAAPSGTIGVHLNGQFATEGDPWAACGAAYEQLGFLDADGAPDAKGALRITLYARTAAWVQVNALTIFSTSWQMLPITGLEYEDLLGQHVLTRLSFDARQITLPSFDTLEEIRPVIFGRLDAEVHTLLTNWHANFPLTLTEPPGRAVTGRAGSCATELCGLTPPTIPAEETPPPEGAEEAGKNYLYTTVCGSDFYNNNATFTLVWGDAACDKSVFLELFRAVLAKCQADYVEANGPTAFGPAFWCRQGSHNGVMAGAFMDFDGVPLRPWYTDLDEVPAGEICPRMTTFVEGFWCLECEILP